MRRLLALTLAGLAVATPVFAQSKFTLRVHTGRGQSGHDVNSTMIIGEKDVLLVDPQFSLSEAHRLAAELLESGKHLAVICSFGHRRSNAAARGGVSMRTRTKHGQSHQND